VFPNLNPMELLVVFGVAVLLFGKKLPEVSRSLGRGFEDEFRSISNTTSHAISSYSSVDHDFGLSSQDTHTPTAPKFEPPSSSPLPRMESEPLKYED
jgi:sec-independent protein translocase protein TatA